VHIRIRKYEIRANRLQETKRAEMMKKALFVLAMSLGLIAVVGGAAIRAQQPAASPNYADTIAWIQQNINAAAWSYTFKAAQTDAAQATTKVVWESFSFGQAAPCHLTLLARKQIVARGYQEDKPDTTTSYDMDLSALEANGIQAVPFDLVAWASQTMEPVMPENGDTLTTPSPSYWEIKGFDYMTSSGVSTLDEGFDLLLVSDQGMAQRIVTALNHAVDLCGGKPAPKSLF
jgi:hypothetical protein